MRVAAADDDVELAFVIIGLDEGAGVVAALGPEQHAILPDDLLAGFRVLRDILMMIDDQRGQHVARQKTLEVELEGHGIEGDEVVRGLLRLEQCRNY